MPELAWGAQGVYVCRAHAPGGQAEDRATLTVQGRSSARAPGAWAPPDLSPRTVTPWDPHLPSPVGTH